MSGFTAPAPATDTPITQDGWWPDVMPEQCRTHMRIDGTVSAERLRVALIMAVASVNAELVTWRYTQESAGTTSMATVPGPSIDGQAITVHHYLHAVRCTAAAWLTERYRNFDTTNDGEQKAEAMTAALDELRRDARWAISDILGHTRTTVELI